MNIYRVTKCKSFLALLSSAFLFIFVSTSCGSTNNSNGKNTFKSDKSISTKQNITTEIPNLDLKNDSTENLWGTEDFLQYTRIWILGDSNNITNIFFAVHGDGASDYSDSTNNDRKEMEMNLPSGEGAVVAYLLSNGDDWPGFSGINEQRENGVGLLKAFRQIEKAAGNRNIAFQQFSLSGGGRVDHGLLRLILEKYENDDSGLDVKYFVDNQLKGMHSGEALSYNLGGETGLVRSWIDMLKEHNTVRASFVLSPNSDYNYMWERAVEIGKEFGGEQFPRGGEYQVENGRIRFWGGDSHFNCWKDNFAKAFFNL